MAYGWVVTTDALGLHRRSPAELKAVMSAERLGTAFLEYRDGDDAQRIVPLDPGVERVSIGRLPNCELALAWDGEVSRAHALLEQVGGAWTLEDRGSSNGTLVNTVRIMGPCMLHDGDVIRVGRTQLIFHGGGDADMRRTTPALDRAAPTLTDSQRKVLVELCRPGAGHRRRRRVQPGDRRGAVRERRDGQDAHARAVRRLRRGRRAAVPQAHGTGATGARNRSRHGPRSRAALSYNLSLPD